MSEDTPPPIKPEPIPIEVRPTPTWAMVGVLIRQLALIAGAMTSVFSLLRERDFRGIFDYIQGDEATQVAIVVVGAVAMIWGLVREWKIWKKLRTLEAHVSDRIAVIRGKLESLRERWFNPRK